MQGRRFREADFSPIIAVDFAACAAGAEGQKRSHFDMSSNRCSYYSKRGGSEVASSIYMWAPPDPTTPPTAPTPTHLPADLNP